MPPTKSDDSPPLAKPRRRRWLLRTLAVLTGLLVAFGIAETTVRMLGETDEDGNFFFSEKPVGAARPPVEWVRRKIEQYQKSEKSRMIYDRQTGWSPRPNNTTHQGMYRYDARGIRTAAEDHDVTPTPGVARVALFGDSFTHADDVPFEQTWGAHLEARLNDAAADDGTAFEVVNFGVSAYGMDQAFLRWRFLGAKYRPKIVLFGFQAENVNRNVNLLRGFYVLHTGIPFSKPRFVFDSAGALEAINLPTLPLDDVPRVMANMDDWQYARHEWFYNPDDYQRRFWHRSRFVSLLMGRLTDSDERGISRPGPTFSSDSEPARITRQILRDFRSEVEQQGGEFYVVHLPKKSDLRRLLSGGELPYTGLWQRVASEHQTIDPVPFLLKAASRRGLESLFAAPKRAHYSNRANRILAEVIALSLTTLR